MLLRISLIFAILAGLGALAVSQLKVKAKLDKITGERDANATQRDQANADAAAARDAAKKAKDDQDKATRELADANALLETVTAKATEQERRANGLQTNLEKTTQDRNEARQDLAAWTVIGIPVNQILNRLAQIDVVTKEKDAFVTENTLLLRKLRIAEAEVDKIRGPLKEVALPAGLKGKVTAVDPKWDFVVLDIGEKDGVLERGKLMVSRGGKLVGKVQIVRVEQERSIANVLPDWKQVDVLEGDQVLY